MTPDQVARFTAAFEGLAAELRKMQLDPLWMARFNPVAYVALRRAERYATPVTSGPATASASAVPPGSHLARP
jgi:hypothetical protein